MDVSCPRNRWNYPPRLRFGALPAISKTRATKKSTSYQKVCPRVGVGSMTPDPLSQCIPMSHALFWSLNSYEHWLLSNHTINKLHSWLMADSHFPVYQMKFLVSNSISLFNIQQKTTVGFRWFSACRSYRSIISASFALSTCFTKRRANATTQHKAARVKDAPVLGSKCIEEFAG